MRFDFISKKRLNIQGAPRFSILCIWNKVAIEFIHCKERKKRNRIKDAFDAKNSYISTHTHALAKNDVWWSCQYAVKKKLPRNYEANAKYSCHLKWPALEATSINLSRANAWCNQYSQNSFRPKGFAHTLIRAIYLFANFHAVDETRFCLLKSKSSRMHLCLNDFFFVAFTDAAVTAATVVALNRTLNECLKVKQDFLTDVNSEMSFTHSKTRKSIINMPIYGYKYIIYANFKCQSHHIGLN